MFGTESRKNIGYTKSETSYSRGLISGNISMASKWIQGGDLDDIWKSGAIGFASGVIGGWAQLNFADKIPHGWASGILPDDVFRNGLGNMVSGSMYGAADRAITSYENGVRGGNLLLHSFLGSLEGGLAGFATGTGSGMYSILKAPSVRSIISSTITSVPGWGLRTGKVLLTLTGAAGADALAGSGASLFWRILGFSGLLGGEIGLQSNYFNITKWLNQIKYPDPFPIKWL